MAKLKLIRTPARQPAVSDSTRDWYRPPVQRACTAMAVQGKRVVEGRIAATGEQVRSLMEMLDLTQKNLAAAIGVKQQAVSLWLSGKTEPDTFCLLNLALISAKHSSKKQAQSTKPALDAAKELRALARTFFEKSGIEASALVDLACFLGFAMPGVSASCSEQSVDSERSVDSGTGEIETDRSNSTNSKHK